MLGTQVTAETRLLLGVRSVSQRSCGGQTTLGVSLRMRYNRLSQLMFFMVTAQEARFRQISAQ